MIQYSPVKPVFNYVSEVRSEISKVVWPKRENVIRLTLIVLIISFAVSAYTGLLDLIFVNLLGTVLNR